VDNNSMPKTNIAEPTQYTPPIVRTRASQRGHLLADRLTVVPQSSHGRSRGAGVVAALAARMNDVERRRPNEGRASAGWNVVSGASDKKSMRGAIVKALWRFRAFNLDNVTLGGSDHENDRVALRRTRSDGAARVMRRPAEAAD
jgi:hypothetical protein